MHVFFKKIHKIVTITMYSNTMETLVMDLGKINFTSCKMYVPYIIKKGKICNKELWNITPAEVKKIYLYSSP